ncbi:acetolactate synthase AlsS [Aeromonas sp. FDAARGOS 1416]|uniref:acetolactate synthase AlsS n=1 Tax=Aeromonas TaxID=642 RepID=UPI001C22EF77|nr:acetolactate synthase AlsS [Aeromonas sp. FDAARGOS 1416]QXB02098.1 acetolactate synthase AlsS [Aeromonas sp. FDAARGOS 1416]
MENRQWKCGAELVVRHLEAQGVKQVFGIPGAKIDRVFDALEDSPIETIVVRHEANAAFMAAAVGRLTGKAGVALVTSGPGCSNLITGLATATSEGDPMVALGGAVRRADGLKLTHQSMDTVNLCRPVTKFSAQVNSGAAISEVMANAFRAAELGRPGAAFVSLPMDIINKPVQGNVLVPREVPEPGCADEQNMEQALTLLRNAQNPVVLLGLMASRPENAEAVRAFLDKARLPVTGTYQAAGVVDSCHFDDFAGRVGLFNNQPGDQLLAGADLVICIGYSPIEYDPVLWNGDRERRILHIDVLPADIDSSYCPTAELVGSIRANLLQLTRIMGNPKIRPPEVDRLLQGVRQQRLRLAMRADDLHGNPVHPLRIVRELQDLVRDDMTLCVDMGSFHIWIARYLYSFRARQVLISNGQQTMGVALPWAIGAALVRPGEKVISVSGDGSFMQSSMELETAVRLKSNIVHIIWVDNGYNMVAMQEQHKYCRTSGVSFGPIDFKRYAESFGAAGFAVRSADELRATLRAALAVEGPAVVAIPVDYSDNPGLMAQLRPEVLA